MLWGNFYLNGPDGLEKCEVVIFDELSDFQCYVMSVVVFEV